MPLAYRAFQSIEKIKRGFESQLFHIEKGLN